jgi:hypothetical protein
MNMGKFPHKVELVGGLGQAAVVEHGVAGDGVLGVQEGVSLADRPLAMMVCSELTTSSSLVVLLDSLHPVSLLSTVTRSTVGWFLVDVQRQQPLGEPGAAACVDRWTSAAVDTRSQLPPPITGGVGGRGRKRRDGRLEEEERRRLGGG